MNRLLQLPLTLIEDNTRQQLAEVDLGLDSIAAWCLDLCLLEKRLIDTVTIVGGRAGAPKLRIECDPNVPAPGVVHWLPDGMCLRITHVELEHWIHFFLKHYRDGVGEVNHIDVDVPPAETDSLKGLFLVLRVPSALQPVSEEEARRILGLPMRSGIEAG